MKICGPFECNICNRRCSSAEDLANHKKLHKKRGHHEPTELSRRKRRNIDPEYHCRTVGCEKVFPSRALLQKHKVDVHIDPDRVHNWNEPYPWNIGKNEVNEKLRDTLIDNRNFVFQNHFHDSTHSTYNFPIRGDGDWHSVVREKLNVVKKANPDAVKLNACLGYVLEDEETKKYRYFAPGENFPLFEYPVRIDREGDWESAINNLDIRRVLDNVELTRPDTNSELRMVTNINITVSYLGVNMGNGIIPDYVKRNHNIICLDAIRHGFPFQDRKCAVRALAFHQLSNNDPTQRTPPEYVTDRQLRIRTLELAKQWDMDGLDLSDVGKFEDKFDIDVDIYSLQPDESVTLIYMTRGKRGITKRITLNLHEQHLSYVSYTKAYLIKYQCLACKRHFSQLTDLKRHRRICTQTTLRSFRFNHYQPAKTIFEKLECEGINVDLNNRTYRWFGTFGCEAIQIDTKDGSIYTKQHQLVSMTVSSNIDEFREPICFKGKNPNDIVTSAVKHFKKMVDKAGIFARKQWSSTIDELDKKIEQAREHELNIATTDKVYHEDNDNDVDDDVDATVVYRSEQRLLNLRDEFIRYCNTVPLVGFSSSHYDMNLIKPYLFPAIGVSRQSNDEMFALPHDPNAFVIKKNNTYTSVTANNMRFLDIGNFLALGTTLESCLKAHGAKDSLVEAVENMQHFYFHVISTSSSRQYLYLASLDFFCSRLPANRM